MNGTLFGIPFWLLAAGGIGYLVLRKKKARFGPSRITPYTRAEYEAARRELEVSPDIWAEEPAATVVSYTAEEEAFDVPIDMPGIETMGPGVGW